MKRSLLAAGLLLAGGMLCGCQPPRSAADVELADGGFPPALSDMEYHEDPWNRTDCRECHQDETGDAPPIVHENVAPTAAQGKCRICHVPVEGNYVE